MRDIQWNRDWFPNLNNFPFHHWESKSNQKQFLESIASSFGISSPKDWGKVTNEHVIQRGGKALLHHYDGSLFRCLQSVYNETSWKREWFKNIPLYPSTHWKNPNNQKTFLDGLASHYHLKKPEDWKRISISLIRKKGGEVLIHFPLSSSKLGTFKTIWTFIIESS